ncbi:MAG: hypothetical protein MR767_10005, partial [Christensenellaceae bacterium]|nr:hypothetical protein [Christensenellaceae bacterium]
ILLALFPQSFPAKPSPSFPFLLRCLEYIKTVNHVIAQSVNYLTALYSKPALITLNYPADAKLIAKEETNAQT